MRAAVQADRSQWNKDVTTPYYSYNRPGAKVSELTIYQFSRHSQSFGNGRARSISLTAVRRPRVNQDSLLLASFLG